MDTMDFVVDADEGQRAALLFDAGQVDTQSEQGTMFTSGSEAQRVPLRLLENEPALSRIPVVLVEEAAECTFADQFCTVECRFGRGIEEQGERSPEAALLVAGGGDGQELICQNADALLRSSVT